MRTEAKIIADSISSRWHRLTTMEVTLHRFVLAEFNTHRVFSRNSASSRAIPVQKQLDRIIESPALPLKHPCEQKGMQGGDELEGQDLLDAQDLIRDIFVTSTSLVQNYVDTHEPEHRLHKSVLNRYLEPFMWHTIVVSSTEWGNFFGLRCSPMAQPEIRAAADLMLEAYRTSSPVYCETGEWHLPYVTEEERLNLNLVTQQIISVARCTRVSSLHAGDIKDYVEDERLYRQLTSASPMHASPLEHVAVPCNTSSHFTANFDGWHQLRHTGDRP